MITNLRNLFEIHYDLNKNLHLQLKAYRKSMGLNQKEMAELSGISHGTMKRIEAGEDVGFHKVMKYMETILKQLL